MIISEINFFSDTLGIRTTLGAILPQRTFKDAKHGERPAYRPLYLLHGYSDDHTAWQRWTSIERYAEKHNLAVIMPAVNLSFYTDMAHGGKYWQFISEEIPVIARDLFPLSPNRADTFVAGLSMGGYGAFKLALSHPDRFAAAASLSGAVDICAVVREHGRPDEENWLEVMRNIFGNLTEVPGSQHDLFALAEKVSKEKVKPKLYQCCGTEDFLYADNIRFRDHVRNIPVDLTYDEGPGTHEWGYWDSQIQTVLDWLDLP